MQLLALNLWKTNSMIFAMYEQVDLRHRGSDEARLLEGVFPIKEEVLDVMILVQWPPNSWFHKKCTPQSREALQIRQSTSGQKSDKRHFSTSFICVWLCLLQLSNPTALNSKSVCEVIHYLGVVSFVCHQQGPKLTSSPNIASSLNLSTRPIQQAFERLQRSSPAFSRGHCYA